VSQVYQQVVALLHDDELQALCAGLDAIKPDKPVPDIVARFCALCADLVAAQQSPTRVPDHLERWLREHPVRVSVRDLHMAAMRPDPPPPPLSLANYPVKALPHPDDFFDVDDWLNG
jgi:hypothetical protein